MLLGNDLDNFHNFFHKLLILWIIHVVLSLMSRLVHIFSLTMLLTVFVFPQVRQSQSGCCQCFASRTQGPHSFIIGSKIAHRPSNTSIIAFCSITQYPASIDQSPIRSIFSRLAIDQSSTHFQISPTHSQTHSTRLPGSFVSRITLSFGYLTPFDLTPLTSGVQRSTAQSTRLVLNQFCCC